MKANRELMAKTLCNINMDMVGESPHLNRSFMCLMRTSYGNAHYINDVMENYYRFVGEGQPGADPVPERVRQGSHAASSPRAGPDEPFYYSIETHYGASDHMVFNDWGVQVPGIMMIAWPDQWYHTSGDRVDKADPTQMKRVVAIIGAAGCLHGRERRPMTWRSRIASETTSNARGAGWDTSSSMGLQERLNDCDRRQSSGACTEWARSARRGHAVHQREGDTRRRCSQLADDATVGLGRATSSQDVSRAIDQDRSGRIWAGARDAHAGRSRLSLNVKTGTVAGSTDLERRSVALHGSVPAPDSTGHRQDGYGGWRELTCSRCLQRGTERSVPLHQTQRSPTRVSFSLLINGTNSVLDIKKMMDAQYRTTSELQAIMNYLEVLKLAGLIELEQ